MTAQLDFLAAVPARTRAKRRHNVTPYIHRLEITGGRVHASGGFQVRIRRLGVAEWFGDSTYGGDRAAALRAAMVFRDQAQREGWRANG